MPNLPQCLTNENALLGDSAVLDFMLQSAHFRGVLFVTGIDTDIGKTYATGFLARLLHQAGRRVITQKLVQTGSQDIACDIITHRQIMRLPFFPEDHARLTMPIVLPYPASPHLSARLSCATIDTDFIDSCTKQLCWHYETVLIEGAGGLCVPLTETLLTLDYITARRYPVILVSSGRLGSINHTLLSLDALKRRGIALAMLVYNRHGESNQLIGDDSCQFLQNYLAQHFASSVFWQLPSLVL